MTGPSQDIPKGDAEPEFAVRPATPQDVESVIAFLLNAGPMASPVEAELSSGPGEPSGDGEEENPLFSEERGFWVWVARRDGDESGPLAGSVTLRRLEQSSAQMSGLYVAQDLRGMGIGHLLVQESLRFCSENGFIKVLLDTFKDQTRAIHLFERVGFQLSRKKESQGKESLEFYLDLYRRPDGAGD